MSFEKLPAGGGACGWIQKSTESARLSFHCRPRNRGKVSPQADHTDTPCENWRQLPSAGISSAVFLAYPSLTSSETWKKIQSEQVVNQVLYSAMYGRQYQNKQHGETMPEKACDIFLCSLQINIKKCARCGSVLRDTCVLFKLYLFPTQL